MGPILPVILNDPERALNVSRRLLSDGFFVPAIRPPTVPEGTSRLRVSLTSAHTGDDLARFVRALEVAIESER
jgi:7-keto-8-aminopelargonate synthetase-like enzyme